MQNFIGDKVEDLIANWNPKPFLYLDKYSVNLVEVTLDNEHQGHYYSVDLTDLSLEYHPTLLDLMVVLLMVGTIVLMVGSAVLMLGSIVLMISSAILLVGSIVPMIAMSMIVSMSRSYMLTEPALPVCPGLAAIINQRGTLQRRGDLHRVEF